MPWLFLGGGILLLIIWWLWTKPPSTKLGINNVTLTVAQKALPCGSPRKFQCEVRAFGWSDDGISRNYTIEIYDEDPLSHDELARYDSVTGGSPGTTITLSKTKKAHTWDVTKTLELWCTDSCHVAGKEGDSREANPLIFARFILKHGSPYPTLDSRTLPLWCIRDASYSGSDDGAGGSQ